MCLAASLVLVGAGMLQPISPTGIPAASSAAEVQLDIEQKAGRAGICTGTGFCWILPARSDASPARMAGDAGHRLVRGDRANAKWTADPPDQPPRRAG